MYCNNLLNIETGDHLRSARLLILFFLCASCGQTRPVPTSIELVESADLIERSDFQLDLDPQYKTHSDTQESFGQMGISEFSQTLFENYLETQENDQITKLQLREKFDAIIQYVGRTTLDSLLVPNSTIFRKKYEHSIEISTLNEVSFSASEATLPSIVNTAEMDPTSSTLLYFWLSNMYFGPNAFYNNFPVVVFTDDSLLPGFMRYDGENWHLYGVDTKKIPNPREDSYVYFGQTNLLHSYKKDGDHSKIRVMDAQYFLFITTMKDKLSNIEQLTTQAFENTANYYGIDLSALEENIQASPIAIEALPKYNSDQLLKSKTSTTGNRVLAHASSYFDNLEYRHSGVIYIDESSANQAPSEFQKKLESASFKFVEEHFGYKLSSIIVNDTKKRLGVNFQNNKDLKRRIDKLSGPVFSGRLSGMPFFISISKSSEIVFYQPLDKRYCHYNLDMWKHIGKALGKKSFHLIRVNQHFPSTLLSLDEELVRIEDREVSEAILYTQFIK